MDGPVVKAAARALETGNVNLALAWVPAEGEREVRDAFEQARRARLGGDDAARVADRWFFETVVRVHRRGEGASFEGLKPAGLDHGPVLALAEKALDAGEVGAVAHFLAHALEERLQHRLQAALALRRHDPNDVKAARRYVEALLDFELFAHRAYEFIHGSLRHGEAGPKPTAAAHAH